MIFLTEVVSEATGTEVLTAVAEPVQESLNILELAMKGPPI